MTRLRLFFCVLVGTAGSLGACHYSEEDKWRACCRMSIDREDKSNVASSRTIVDLLSGMGFAADTGEPLGPINDIPTGFGGTKQDILTAMNRFLASHPKDRPIDYFRELGMTCTPATSTTADVVRCDVELPIQVKCSPRGKMGPPLPDELQRPMPARLSWQVDISQSALLSGEARVRPVPGGRLCHR